REVLGQTKPSKTTTSLFLPCEYCVNCLLLPKVTTKSPNDSKRRNRQRQGFLVLPFRVLRVFRGSSKGNHERLEILEKAKPSKTGISLFFPLFSFVIFCIFQV